MEYFHSKTDRAIRLKDIPETGAAELIKSAASQCSGGKQLLGFFGDNAGADRVRLYVILSDPEISEILAGSCLFDRGGSYESLTPMLPRFNMYEREFFEQYGIIPAGHPRLQPVRNTDEYVYLRRQGEDSHEVAVGPVHAGIIEPGHFRFICEGEKVMNLEIGLGYQHRGVEKMIESAGPWKAAILAESISGDTVCGHSAAYCQAIEALSGAEVSRRSHAIRAIAIEMERMAMHAYGLASISNDIAFLMGSAVFGANRTTIINTSLLISGSRLGRGLIVPGGVAFDINSEKAKTIKANIGDACSKIGQMAEEMFSSASVMSRLQETGVVTKADAMAHGLTGFAARASGIAIDARADHPYGAYIEYPVTKITLGSGDVFARTCLRNMEIEQSLKLVNEMCENLPQGRLLDRADVLMPEAMAISCVEGWRGPVVHAAITDSKGNLRRYKIKDPSFDNWTGLALAVRGNGISDFPLCNKSFDLSYCGNDL